MARQAGSRRPRPSRAARHRELNERPPLVSTGAPPSTPVSAPTLHVPSPQRDETPRCSRPAARPSKNYCCLSTYGCVDGGPVDGHVDHGPLVVGGGGEDLFGAAAENGVAV